MLRDMVQLAGDGFALEDVGAQDRHLQAGTTQPARGVIELRRRQCMEAASRIEPRFRRGLFSVDQLREDGQRIAGLEQATIVLLALADVADETDLAEGEGGSTLQGLQVFIHGKGGCMRACMWLSIACRGLC